MIRDGFKEVKTTTVKEERKKAAMGERSFYAQKIPKLRDLNKAVTFSTVATLIMLTLAYAISVLSFVASKINPEAEYSLARFIIWSCVYGVIVLFTLAWFIIIRPSNNRKIERYKQALEQLSVKNLGKISAASTVYGADYVKNLSARRAKEREDAKRIAEEKAAEKTTVDEKTENVADNAENLQNNADDAEK